MTSRRGPSPSTRAVPWAALALLFTIGCAAAKPPDHPLSTDPASVASGPEPVAAPGLLTLFVDEAEGTVHARVPLDRPLLLITSLVTGVGNNALGLDRGMLGTRHVVHFERHGKKVLLVEDNLAFRATTADAAEARATAEAFATSVLWGFTVAREVDGSPVVDLTEFALRDGPGIARHLTERKQGSFAPEASRSAVVGAKTKSFPKNTEVTARVTFLSSKPGPLVAAVTPTPGALTVTLRNSFIALPEVPMVALPFDPRAGGLALSYADYAAPLSASVHKRLALRHRLERKPGTSEVVAPIIYYLDRGAPEPIRSALLDGARWWASAFEAAGFAGAFAVELLPEDADPLDVRYNVINWVHRSTRGWSYGDSIIDPRSGEILKGHISLGSLRVRQDMLLAEGLLAPYADGKTSDPRVDALALARLRQLAAHEVGHTLGLSHNFAASAADRVSVMDYPHPLVRLVDGKLDVSAAYGVGVGAWDTVAIRYAYADLTPAARAAVLDEAYARGLRFISDADARPAGGAHPTAHLWDNGADPVAELLRLMAVRQHALTRFGPAAVRPGAPLATLEEALVPLYLMHRYQVEAVVKLIGGVDYTYAHRGDGRLVTEPVPQPVQLRALSAILDTLVPAALALPESVVAGIPPRPMAFDAPGRRERFTRRTGRVFDPLAPATAAAAHTIGLLLHPERATRLADDDRLAPMLDQLRRRLVTKDGEGVSAVVTDTLIGGLMRLAKSRARATARAEAEAALEAVRLDLRRNKSAFAAAQRRRIERFLKDPSEAPTPSYGPVPPGSPIGWPTGAWPDAPADDEPGAPAFAPRDQPLGCRW